MQPGTAFLLMSRAAVVDFPEMVRQAASGRLKVACDVFPEEPVAADDPVRGVEGMLLSAHRTGGMQDALFEIGRQAVADAELILKGLAPVTCRRAQRETVGRSRSKPVTADLSPRLLTRRDKAREHPCHRRGYRGSQPERRRRP